MFTGIKDEVPRWEASGMGKCFKDDSRHPRDSCLYFPDSWFHLEPASPNELLIGGKSSWPNQHRQSWRSVRRMGGFLNPSSRLAKTVANSMMNHSNDTAETHKLQGGQCWVQKASDLLGKPHNGKFLANGRNFVSPTSTALRLVPHAVELDCFFPYSVFPKNWNPVLPQEIILRIYLCISLVIM